jgi:hypothetical protein
MRSLQNIFLLQHKDTKSQRHKGEVFNKVLSVFVLLGIDLAVTYFFILSIRLINFFHKPSPIISSAA